MSNTLIQIKRSTSTSAPASLSIGELAYSYQSNTLFIGDSSGSGVIAITSAGAGPLEIANAYSRVFANSVGAAANAHAESYTDTVVLANLAIANAYSRVFANSVGSAANAYADGLASSQLSSSKSYTDTVVVANLAIANAYSRVFANSVGDSVNAYASQTYYSKTGGTVSGDMVVTGNLTISGVTTYANTQTLLIGDNILTLNADLPNNVTPSEDAGVEVNRGNKNSNAAIIWNETACSWMFTSNTLIGYTKKIASNTDVDSAGAGANAYTDTAISSNASQVNLYSRTFANTVGAAGNTYADTVVSANLALSKSYTDTVVVANLAIANAYSRVFANSVGDSVNANISVATVAANAYAALLAANGSYISSGIVKVPYGGTGQTSFTTNGIVYGNSSGDLKVTSAGSEGQVLQADSTGVPSFGMLDGGSF